MYKVYYLTSDIDLNIPMYIGMTKRTLTQRLKDHKDHKRGYNKKDSWKTERDKQISIHIIQDNILTFSEAATLELQWINYWKEKNPDLKNSVVYKLAEHPYTNAMENIKKNISEGIIAKKCKSIVVLDINQNFIQEFRTIKSASAQLNVKEEIISKNLRNLTKSNKFIFMYKDEYDTIFDYNYKIYKAKERKRCSIKPTISDKCRKAVRKEVIVVNLITKEILEFSSQQEVCELLNCSSSLVSRYKKTSEILRNTFQFYNKDIVRSSEKSEINKR